MRNTAIKVGFTDNSTIQLRLELGTVKDAKQTTNVPAGLSPNDEGYVYDNTWPGGWVGRVTGADGQYFQYFDDYLPSDIDDLFDIDTNNADRDAAVDDLSRWTVRVNGEVVDIAGLSRKANILETAETSLFSFEFRTAQNVFLDLDTPLSAQDVVTISFDDPDFDPVTTRFAPWSTVSEAIHVNLTGYDPDDLVKKAYLSSWNGWRLDADAPDGGVSVAQTYAPGTRFAVVNADTGAVVKNGTIQMAQAITEPNNFWNNFNRTDVWEMDFSDIDQAGDYYVRVNGVGISQTFTIGESHWDDLFDVSFSGFYHQRSGIALEAPYTEFVRPASLVPGEDLTVLRTTVKITDTSEGGGDGKPFDLFPDAVTGEAVDAWGGWHDAGDWDRRTSHLEAARNMIELVEMTGAWGRDDTRNIPEQGDGIPDILQEAMWGIEVFMRLQTPDGGIPGGIEQRAYQGFGGASWTEGPVIYAYAPDVWSSWEYAAAAAKVAHTLKAYDPTTAAQWRDSAVAAMDYAEANWQAELGGTPASRDVISRNIAALELYRETGDVKYHDIFEATSAYADGDVSNVAWNEHQFEAAFLYATMGDLALNTTIRETGLADIQAEIDLLMDIGSRSAFGDLFNPYAPYGWGNTATQPNHSQDVFVRMHHLTGDDALLKVIQDDVQYAFGANPLNMVYMTGLDGVRGPEELLNLDGEALGYGPVPGVTVYGEYHIHDYGWDFFHDIMYADQWPNVWQAPVRESWQGFSVYVPVTEYTVQQGITDMSYVTGYLAAQQADAGTGGTPTPADDIRMEVGQVSTGQGPADRWHKIAFSQTIEDAVVVMGPASLEGQHALSVRVRNVTDAGFEFQMDEWDYLDGPHTKETISWVAGSAGQHELVGGGTIAFGATQTANSGDVDLSGFDNDVMVFGTTGAQTASATAHRIFDVDRDGFQFRFFAEEGNVNRRPADTLSWVAVEQTASQADMGRVTASHREADIPGEPAKALFADMQSLNGGNTATLRYQLEGNGKLSLTVQEEQSKDFERVHAPEDVVWMQLQTGIYDLI